MKKKTFLITGLLSIMVSTATFAADSNAIDIGVIALSLASQIYLFGNLVVVLMMVLGFWCLYKIIMTFANREDERAYPMKAVPLYFLGAAVGLGSSMSSDLVQITLFGKKTESIKDAVFVMPSGSSNGSSK